MKGLFYSIIVLLFVAPLIMFTLISINMPQSRTEITYSKAVGDKMAAYAKSIDEDMPRVFNIMAKRSLVQAVTYIETNGTPLSNSTAILVEVISNGTINGGATSQTFTATQWASVVLDKGQKYGFITDVKIIEIKFFSLDSYNVGVEGRISVNISDPYAEMSMYRVYNKTIPVSIEGLNDPLYILGTNGVIKRSITTSSINLSGAANFDSAVSGELYMPSQNGAGFLDRLEGRLSASGKYNKSNVITGLESVVFVPDLQSNGISIKNNQSMIDYLYFNTSSIIGGHVSGSSYNWLVIESAHATTYNLTIA